MLPTATSLARRVAIVNASFAQHYFGSPQAALGRVVDFGNVQNPVNTYVIGVVGDTKHQGCVLR